MFSLTGVYGYGQHTSLTLSSIHIVGFASCNNLRANGIDVKLTIISSPAGRIVLQQVSAGPLAGNVEFHIPAWPGLTCGDKIEFTVETYCNGQWDKNDFIKVIECFCPYMEVQPPVYGSCTGTPLMQVVTLNATVLLPPKSNLPYQWDYGDSHVDPVQHLSNGSTSWMAQTLTTTHDYPANGQSYTACLRSGECPKACVTVEPNCKPSTSDCPLVVTDPPQISAQCVNGKRTVTFTAHVTPKTTPTMMQWNYGGGNFSQLSVLSVGTTSAVLGTSQYTPGNYQANLQVTLLQGSCQDIPVSFVVPPCDTLPCPDPTRPVTITVTTPVTEKWCAPVQGLAATFSAQVNWVSPMPNNPPMPVRYDWTITLPDHRVATQSSSGRNVSTASGWSGSGAINGAVDLHDGGSYAIGVIAVFGSGVSLPTDASGANACNLGGADSFVLIACPSETPCPSLSGLTTTAACADSDKGTVANITATANVNDPAGLANSFVWDFGDPGSSNNQITTTTPSASHSYHQPGNYTIKCRVQSSAACNDNGPKEFTTGLTVSQCRGGDSDGGFGCFLLRGVAVVLLALALLCLLLGICFPVLTPAIDYVAAGLAVAAAVAIAFWVVLCPKPCAWLLLMLAQTVFGVGWVSVIFWNCCAWLGWLGGGLLLLGIGLFMAWAYQCKVGWCHTLKEMAIVLSGVVIPAIGFIKLIPVANACVIPSVEAAMGVLAGIILSVALTCKEGG